MKHFFSLLCLALMSFFYANKAAAILLLKQNPTPPLEPASYSMDDDSYQTAKVRFLPDYQRNLIGNQFGSRVNEGGRTKSNSDCAAYGYISSCPDKKMGSGVKHPVGGLTCYKECVCDTSYYKYSSSNCASPKVLGGESCVNEGKTLYSQCTCSTAYSLNSCPPGAICSECGGKYKQTGCKSEYNRSSKITLNASCSSCSYNGTTKYKCTCNSGYTLSGDSCVAQCPGYTLTVCPIEGGATCSKCPTNSTKLKLSSCDVAHGWKISSDSTRCIAVPCPAGFTAGVTSCSSSSTKPTLSLNGWSGGKQCGVCKCNNIDSTCTAANYPLTSQSVPHATYESCNTGCGSEKVTRYKIASCNYAYKFNSTKTGCVEQICTEIESYYISEEKEHMICNKDTFHNGKTVCFHGCTCDPGYFPNRYDNCQECERGTYSASRLLTGHHLEGCPNKCPKGQYQDAKAQISCKPCPAGQHQDTEGQWSCKPCPVNTYSSGTGATSCTPCSAGTSTNGKTGQTSCQAVTTTCEAGYYYKNGACEPCPAGTVKASAGNATSCESCDANEIPSPKRTHCVHLKYVFAKMSCIGDIPKNSQGNICYLNEYNEGGTYEPKDYCYVKNNNEIDCLNSINPSTEYKITFKDSSWQNSYCIGTLAQCNLTNGTNEWYIKGMTYIYECTYSEYNSNGGIVNEKSFQNNDPIKMVPAILTHYGLTCPLTVGKKKAVGDNWNFCAEELGETCGTGYE